MCPGCSAGGCSNRRRTTCTSTGQGASRSPKTPTALPSCCWARWTCTCSPKAIIATWPRYSARSPRRWTASTGCALRCGRRMRGGCRWSVTSTTGTGAATRCASACPAVCGSCSSRACRPARRTSTNCSGPTASCRSRPTRWHWPPSCRPAPPRRWPPRWAMCGRTRAGCACVRRTRPPTRRCRSTNCTPVPGNASWMKAVKWLATTTGANWPSGWCPTSRSWASPISS